VKRMLVPRFVVPELHDHLMSFRFNVSTFLTL
jgi:hypothetical protein